MGTITRLIARPEDVEDVAQEVFLRLYFSLDQLRTAEVFEPWLHRLTVNAAYDYLRKQRRRQEFRMSDLSEQQVMLADAAAGGKVEHEEQYRKKIRESVQSLLGAVSEADRILLAELFVRRRDQAEIMFGVLVVILGRDRVAGRACVARGESR